MIRVPSNLLHCAGAFAYGDITYKMCDGGLSKALGLEELTHGTDPISNIKIRMTGGQPSKPGYQPNYSYTNTTGYFYLFKDSEYGLINGKPFKSSRETHEAFATRISEIPLLTKILRTPLSRIERYLWTKNSALNACYMQFCRYVKGSDPFEREASSLDYAVSILGTVLSPPLRFRFEKIDPTRLEEDPNHIGIAYKTREAVEPWRIGPLGSCLTGLNPGWLSRAKDNPLKVLTGFAELGGASALLFLGRSRVRSKLPWIVAGALLA